MGLSRKNSTNRRSVYYPISIFHHSSSNILNKTNPLQSPASSAISSPICNNNSIQIQTRAQNRQKMQHHRSSICVINSSSHSTNQSSVLNSCGMPIQKSTANNLNTSQLELANATSNLNSSLSLSSSLSPSPVTILQSPFRLSTPPSSAKNNSSKLNTNNANTGNSSNINNNTINNNPLILCGNSNSNLNNCGYTSLSGSSCRLSSSKLQLTPATSTSLSQSNNNYFLNMKLD